MEDYEDKGGITRLLDFNGTREDKNTCAIGPSVQHEEIDTTG